MSGFPFRSSQTYSPSSVSTNVPLMNIYWVPGTLAGGVGILMDQTDLFESILEEMALILVPGRKSSAHEVVQIKWYETGQALCTTDKESSVEDSGHVSSGLKHSLSTRLRIWKWLPLSCSAKSTKFNFCLSPFHSTWACVLFHH